jgi:outer membrane protein assembly factor BamB/tRNA A-37 threonylcarbamoyl transferase component Bud32
MVDTRKFAAEGDKSLLGLEGALQANAVLQNRFRIEGVLGVGGMGSVYQARDMQFPDAKRYVAVKEMLHHTNDAKLREIALRNFQREANILAGLSHPAIPTIHDYFSTKERAYLIMEFVNGSDLDSILGRHEGFLPVGQVIEWTITLCDVLEYLHTSEPPIVFRDIKPSNIMVDVFGRLRLIDFGIAKNFTPDEKGTMIGTEGYAAPESYRGLATPSSDIFGVGATLHHVLTRHDPRLEPPFTFAERPIRDTNPEVSPELEAAIMKALAFSPEERYASAVEMKTVLERFLGHRSGPAIVTALSGSDTLPEAVDEWDTGNVGIEARWAFKAEEEIRSTPAIYKKMVFVTAYDNNLYAVDTDNGQLKWAYATEDVIASSPAVEESENLVIFGSKDYSLYAVDTRSGRIKWTYRAAGPIYSSPVIAHGHVFFGSDDGILYALRVATGREAWKYPSQFPIRTKPGITDERVIFGNSDGEVICLDLSGQRKWGVKARREILSSPLIYDKLVFYGSNDGQIYANDLESGWVVWKQQTNKPVVSSPCFGEGMIFVGSVSGKMYALDPDNGRERWTFDTENQITSSPAYFEGSVYFGSNDHHVYCLEAKSGKKKWAYETGGSVPGSPIVEHGVVYIGSTDQNLYALKA